MLYHKYTCYRFYCWVWIPGDFLSEPWLLTVGALRVQCCPVCRDGVDRLAVSRGLLTCCRPHILLSSHADEVNLAKLSETSFTFSWSCFSWPNPSFPFSFIRRVYSWRVCFLWSVLCVRRSWIVSTLPLKVSYVPVVYSHAWIVISPVVMWHVVAVLTLWLKRVKECLADIWKMMGARLLPDDSSLQRELIHIIWTNAESPVSLINIVMLLQLKKINICIHIYNEVKGDYLTFLFAVLSTITHDFTDFLSASQIV